MYAQGWPDKLRSIAWITQILTVTRTHGALLNVVDKTTLYVTHVSPRVARPNSDIATRSSSNPSLSVSAHVHVRAPGTVRASQFFEKRFGVVCSICLPKTEESHHEAA